MLGVRLGIVNNLFLFDVELVIIGFVGENCCIMIFILLSGWLFCWLRIVFNIVLGLGVKLKFKIIFWLMIMIVFWVSVLKFWLDIRIL